MISQGSDEWFAARLGKVTASRVKDVMAKGRGGAPSATRKNYMMELLCERLTGETAPPSLSTPAIRRGTELEPVARGMYEMDSPHDVKEVGLIVHPKIEMFGASPDGLVVLPDGKVAGIEIKCPNTAQHVAVIQSGKHDPQYEWQMLAQMACAELEWVDFVSYDDRLPAPLDYYCHRYERDERRITEMEREVISFLEELDELEQDMRARLLQERAEWH